MDRDVKKTDIKNMPALITQRETMAKKRRCLSAREQKTKVPLTKDIFHFCICNGNWYLKLRLNEAHLFSAMPATASCVSSKSGAPLNELSKLNISRKLKDPYVKDASSIKTTMKSFQGTFRQDIQSGAFHDLAYVTLMTKEVELFRVVALACVLRRFIRDEAIADIVVMVTRNICSKTRGLLKRYFNVVTEVERLPRKRTKFHALGLLSYEKVIFVSNKMILTGNIDELFTLEAPAGVVTIYNDRVQDHWHGVLCRPDDIKTSLQFSHGVKTTLLLLRPNQEEHMKLQTAKQTPKKSDQRHFLPPDNEFISNFYQGRWIHLHNKFSFYPWLESLNYKPVCYDMSRYAPEVWDVDIEHLKPVRDWRKLMIEVSKSDRFVRRSVCGYKWFSADDSQINERKLSSAK